MTEPHSTSIDRSLRVAEWASLRYNLQWAYDGPVWPQARVGTYTNPDTSCWLIRNGSVTLKTEGQKPVTATPGQWVFVAAPSRHQSFSSDAQILSIHFELTWPGDEQLIDRSRNLIFSAEDFPQLENAARPIVRHLRNTFPGANAFLMEQHCTIEHFLLVQKLFPPWIIAYLKTLRHKDVHPQRLKIQDERVMRALAELDNYPLAEKYAEQQILNKVGLSRTQLDHLFSKAYGTTPRRYMEQRRLNEAQRMLKAMDLSIKEIAFRLGFKHASHFSLWFSKLSGSNASEYRRGTKGQGKSGDTLRDSP